MKCLIHINQHIIKANTKNGEDSPPITVKTYKGSTRASRVSILDSSGSTIAVIRYEPEAPLSCGARVWIECDSKNVIIDE